MILLMINALINHKPRIGNTNTNAAIHSFQLVKWLKKTFHVIGKSIISQKHSSSRSLETSFLHIFHASYLVVTEKSFFA